MILGELVQDVLRALARGPWRAPTEDALQVAVHAALQDAGIACVRELVIGDAGRLDLAVLVPDAGTSADCDPIAFKGQLIAIEVKLEASATPVVRQLQRYALAPLVGAVILATTSSRLCAAIPRELAGKPVFAAHLRRF